MEKQNLPSERPSELTLNEDQLKSFNVRISLNDEQRALIKKQTGLDASEMELTTRWDSESHVKLIINKKDLVCW